MRFLGQTLDSIPCNPHRSTAVFVARALSEQRRFVKPLQTCRPPDFSRNYFGQECIEAEAVNHDGSAWCNFLLVIFFLQFLQPFRGCLRILLCESGGDNLAANFSRELADYTRLGSENAAV